MTSGAACRNCWESRLRFVESKPHPLFASASVETWRCGRCYRRSYRLVVNRRTVADVERGYFDDSYTRLSQSARQDRIDASEFAHVN